jgi:hypothetical protein
MCYSDSVNRERTDNAMTQRKGIKSRQCNDPKNQPDDQCVDSSTVELEQSNAEYDLTEVVDSSAEELELSNTKYITIK